MKTTGIVLVVFGSLSILGAIVGASRGHQTSFAGLSFIILGAFLINRANKKQEENEKRKEWENES